MKSETELKEHRGTAMDNAGARGVAGAGQALSFSREPESICYPGTDRVVPARQPPGEMGMEALDPLTRPTDSAARAWPGPIRW